MQRSYRQKRYEVKWTDESKEAVLDQLTKYLEIYGPGESIMQCDDAQVDGLELLAGLDDVVELEYLDDGDEDGDDDADL